MTAARAIGERPLQGAPARRSSTWAGWLEFLGRRQEGYKFTGTCDQTDGDGDKLFMTYEGPESGPIEWIGGTGKYKDIVGKGTWTVADAPGNTQSLFAFTLSYDATWTTKEK